MRLPEPYSPARPLSQLVRWLLRALAALSLALAVIGAFLPIIPAVPFVLLAAWAAARSSPRLLQWLENHPQMGPPIRDWRNGGVVRRGSKWMATIMMCASGVSLAFLARPWWVPVSAITIMSGVCTWLWLRPEQHVRQGDAEG